MSTSATTLAPRPVMRGRDQKFVQRAAAALEPLKAALLDQAHADAANRLQRATAEDAATIAQAEAEAAAILEQARQEGISEAAVLVAAQRRHSRRQARAIELRARAEVIEELRQRSLAEVARLSNEPGYPELRDRLTGYVRTQLGNEAVISDAPTGGVIGAVPGRRLDCSFATLVEHVLAERTAQLNMP